MPDSKKTPLARYRSLLSAGKLQPDAAQEKLVQALDALYAQLCEAGYFEEKDSSGNGFLSFLFRRRKPEHLKSGYYIWGGVGRGKSMLMDLFFESLPFEKKRRVHFHAFMLEVHNRIHALRTKETRADPLLIVANELAERYHVLCFDEFQVHDVADAMILARLFTVLFNKGMVILFTSNRPPESLYLGGLQRARFVAFIDLLLERVQVIELSAQQDYRTGRMAALQKVYVTPLGEDADRFVQDVFSTLRCDGAAQSAEIEVKGRTLRIPMACRDMAVFTFEQLCGQPLAALDYLALAAQYRTFFLTGIPQMGPENRNESKRFVTLIDVLYENHATLICTADVLPEELYAEGDGHFEFQRTVSRLLEMQSLDYLSASHPPLRAVS